MIDSWHEFERGNDRFGVRVTVLQAEMNGLSFKSGYATDWDDVRNEHFVPELVHAARALVMEYFHTLRVYEKDSREDQMATGANLIGVRWVDVNKGDALDVNYRLRLVGRELNVGRDDALYASTPPLAVRRLIVSRGAIS